MSDEDFDFDDDLDLSAIAQLETALTNGTTKAQQTFASTSKVPARANTAPAGLVQKTLFGGNAPVASRSKSTATGTAAAAGNPVPKVKVVKKWDRQVWVKHQGWGKSKAEQARDSRKKKGKGKPVYSDEEDEEMDEEEAGEDSGKFVGDDPELNPSRGPPPMKLKIDEEQAKKWIYPLNRERRDYQFNIARRALFDNVLCSLPTGMGKTLIAAVVMLNFYRFFPEGKVIFVAPSKPLVAQQIEACHTIAGIPPGDVVEMTGNDSPSHRAEAWETKRVFYCTPQTVANDLKLGRLDPSKVVCLVVDEAHKASGNFAYCTIVRYLMQKNPHFRVLALTATPGANVEQVQGVIDSLHIGHIEVRTPDSMDIQRYRYSTHLEKIVVKLTPDFAHLRDKLGQLMKPLVAQFSAIANGRIRKDHDPFIIAPFTIQTIWLDPANRGHKWCFPVGKKLHGYALALQYLLCHSLSAFTAELQKLIEADKNKDSHLTALIREAQNLKNAPGVSGHPKMDKLKELLQAHFEESRKEGMETKAIVFINFRQVVEEVTDFLGSVKGIKATKFIGQGADNKGAKGFSQKEQQGIMAQFREGKYNVMVATSIGEEGLDIGSVDAIFNYDAPKSSIRVMQRTGRTSRERSGKVYVLSAEGREELNWSKAQDDYNKIQTFIVSGKEFELYADCAPLVPNKNTIECEQKMIETTPYVRDSVNIGLIFGNKRKPSVKKPAKDANRNIPDDGHLGFRTATEAMQRPPTKAQKAADRRKKAVLSPSDEADLLKHWIEPARRAREGGIGQLPSKPDISFSALHKVKSLKVKTSASSKRVARAVKVGYACDEGDAQYEEWEAITFSPKKFRQDRVVWRPSTMQQGASIPHRVYRSCRTSATKADTVQINLRSSQLSRTVSLPSSPPLAPGSATVPPRTQSKTNLLSKPSTKKSLAKANSPAIDEIHNEPVFLVPDDTNDSDIDVSGMTWPDLPPTDIPPITKIPDSPAVSPILKPVRSSNRPAKPPTVSTQVLDLDPSDIEETDDEIMPVSPPANVFEPVRIEEMEIDELASDIEDAEAVKEEAPAMMFAVPTSTSSDYGSDIDLDLVKSAEEPKATKNASFPASVVPNSDPYDDFNDFGDSLPDSFMANQLDQIEAQYNKVEPNKVTAPIRAAEMLPPPRPEPKSKDQAVLKSSDPNRKTLRRQPSGGDMLAMAWSGSVPAKVSVRASQTGGSSSPAVNMRKRAVPDTPSEADESSVQLIRRPRRLKRLQNDSDGEVQAEILPTSPPAKKKAKSVQTPAPLPKKKKRKKVDAEANIFFKGAFEAVESGEDNTPTSGSIPPEDSSDREFVDDESRADASGMMEVYRRSVYSAQKPGAFKMGYDRSRPFMQTQRNPSSDVSRYEDSSFVVEDGVIEYEEE